jgi:hypothetical protein
MNQELSRILNLCANISSDNGDNKKTNFILNSIQKIINDDNYKNEFEFLRNIFDISSDCICIENFYGEDDDINPAICYNISFNYKDLSLSLEYYVIYLIKLEETHCERDIIINKKGEDGRIIDIDTLKKEFGINNIDNKSLSNIFTLFFQNFSSTNNLDW